MFLVTDSWILVPTRLLRVSNIMNNLLSGIYYPMTETLVSPRSPLLSRSLLLFIGKGLIERSEVLRKYSLPEPVIGG